ncbi:FkbM family methyltransferase [Methylomonas methanica]|uniref:Methyltransferase FkbM family n=1 Tax=Methylomonas methanica (strain DSM 25384 / MC09) TaxID=857087 RepID=F9ZYV6_METMM|nr:FkbM family methyltransferase [Methylomonas methanica]AEF98652.1 methyltransferase FkbM family [Methylomonas methanica MC09]
MTLKEFGVAFYRAFISPVKARRSYSQCGEDMVLNYLLLDKKQSGFYVDIGCHNPRRGSNTYHFYKKGWRGLLVDLDPEKIIACRMVRWHDQAIVAAVSDKNEPVTVYAPDHFSVLATIDAGSKQDNFKALRTVTSQTLTQILDQIMAPHKFELLCIDAEGVDLAVLKGLDFDRYQAEFICIEIWEASKGLEGLLASEINRYLAEKNYALAGWAGMSAIYKLQKIA